MKDFQYIISYYTLSGKLTQDMEYIYYNRYTLLDPCPYSKYEFNSGPIDMSKLVNTLHRAMVYSK